jgi:hypothetical protein
VKLFDRLKEAALNYARLGWPVFPVHSIEGRECTCHKSGACQAPGKHPRCRHGANEATCEGEKIENWWTQWPSANIGVATGPTSGITVLDIDPRHDGTSHLADLVAKHVTFPRLSCRVPEVVESTMCSGMTPDCGTVPEVSHSALT